MNRFIVMLMLACASSGLAASHAPQELSETLTPLQEIERFEQLLEQVESDEPNLSEDIRRSIESRLVALHDSLTQEANVDNNSQIERIEKLLEKLRRKQKSGNGAGSGATKAEQKPQPSGSDTPSTIISNNQPTTGRAQSSIEERDVQTNEPTDSKPPESKLQSRPVKPAPPIPLSGIADSGTRRESPVQASPAPADTPLPVVMLNSAKSQISALDPNFFSGRPAEKPSEGKIGTFDRPNVGSPMKEPLPEPNLPYQSPPSSRDLALVETESTQSESATTSAPTLTMEESAEQTETPTQRSYSFQRGYNVPSDLTASLKPELRENFKPPIQDETPMEPKTDLIRFLDRNRTVTPRR